MNMEALKQLRNILKIEGIDSISGSKAREKAFEEWVNDWVVEVSASQPIIKKNLTSEDEDFIKYFMAYKLGEELMNDCVQVDSEVTNITTKVMALKR
jgi:hypothetical protein